MGGMNAQTRAVERQASRLRETSWGLVFYFHYGI